MIGVIEAFMTADRARLDSLLRDAARDDGTIDDVVYADFRAGLLRHIAMEEEVLVPFACVKQGVEPLTVARALRRGHRGLVQLLVPAPDRRSCDALRSLLTRHNRLEEGSGGFYAMCDALAGNEKEAFSVVGMLRARSAAPDEPDHDGLLPRLRLVAHMPNAREGHPERVAMRPRRAELAPEGMAARVRRDHATIRALLDALQRACEVAKERREAGLDAFRRAVWDLYITFEEHLDMEESDVAPFLRSSGRAGVARAVAMVLEHNEQRRVLLELVEDAECDVKDVDALVAEATSLVDAFGADMALEDRSLALLLADGSSESSDVSPSPA